MRTKQTYVEQVDDLLAKLRDRMLGYEQSFEELLPEGSEAWTAPQKVNCITQILMFALAVENPRLAYHAEMQETCQWLYTLILYLEQQCNPEDRTFSGMMRLLKLDDDLREIMFEANEYKLLQEPASFLLRSMEGSIQRVLNTRNTAPHRRKLYADIDFLLFSN